MQKLDDNSQLDDNGQLYLLTPGKFDQFDPPGSQPAPYWRATGFTFEDVPTRGFLGIFYKNNPLQFATKLTADKMAAIMLPIVGEVGQYMEEVSIGPFSWADKRMFIIGGVELNAGMEASTYARYPMSYAAGLKARVR